MVGFGTISTPVSLRFSSSPTKSIACNPHSKPGIYFPEKISTNPITRVALAPLRNNNTTHHIFSLLSAFPPFSLQRSQFSPRASSSSSVGSTEYKEEAATKVKFPTSLTLPGCSSPLSLLGTGFREKVFAIIGVKVYATGLYVNQSIFKELDTWKGRSAAEIQENSSLFKSIFQAPLEKSLDIVLVRDIDGKTFWDALDEALSPRIKSPTPVDETALSTFQSIFQGRSLKKGTLIFLTWLDPSKMLVCVSSDGIPSSVDATIESKHVPLALFDVFFGGEPVSPSLKASVANGLAAALK